MTPKQKREHLETLMIMIKGNSFIQDSWGNWLREHDGQTYRIKIKAINIKIERKTSKTWFKIVSKPIVKFTLVDMARFLSRFSD